MPTICNIQPGFIAKLSRNLGNKISNESVKQVIEAFGTAGIAPIAIVMSPGPNTLEAKNEKKYQALRQIPSIILKYGIAFIVTLIVGKKLAKIDWKGILPENMNALLHLKSDSLVANGEDLIKKIGVQNLSEPFKNKFNELHNVSNEIRNLATSGDANKIAQLKQQSTSIIREIRQSGLLNKLQLKEFDSFVIAVKKDAFELYHQMVQVAVALMTLPFSAYLLNVVYPPFVKLAAPGLAKAVEEKNR